MYPCCGFVTVCFFLLVEEVHRSGVDADSSDSDVASGGTASPSTSSMKETSYRKVVGRSQSVSSTGSFVATSEWVSIGVSTFASNRGMELSPKECKEMVISFLKYSLLCRKLVISYYIKNRAVDLRFTIIDTCEIIMNIYVRLSILLMARKSIKHPLLYNKNTESI